MDQIRRRYDGARPIGVVVFNACPGLNVAQDSPTVEWACTLAGTTQTAKVDVGTGAGFFAQPGLETVVIGPGDMVADGHEPDEGLSKADLAAGNAMMARIGAALWG